MHTEQSVIERNALVEKFEIEMLSNITISSKKYLKSCEDNIATLEAKWGKNFDEISKEIEQVKKKEQELHLKEPHLFDGCQNPPQELQMIDGVLLAENHSEDKTRFQYLNSNDHVKKFQREYEALCKNEDSIPPQEKNCLGDCRTEALKIIRKLEKLRMILLIVTFTVKGKVEEYRVGALKYGILLKKHKMYAEALNVFGKYVNEIHELEYCLHYVDVLYNLGNYALAEDYCRWAFNFAYTDKTKASVLFNRARIRSKLEKYPAAYEDLKEAKKLWGDNTAHDTFIKSCQLKLVPIFLKEALALKDGNKLTEALVKINECLSFESERIDIIQLKSEISERLERKAFLSGLKLKNISDENSKVIERCGNLLPTYVFNLSENRCVIEKQQGASRKVVYKKRLNFSNAKPSLCLEGFEDFVLFIDQENKFKLELNNPGFNVAILSKEPVNLACSLKSKGLLYLKAPQVTNHHEQLAAKLVIHGNCINTGKLQAKEIILKRLSGQSRDLTLDNTNGSIITEVGGTLLIRHGAVCNKEGIISAEQCEINANFLDNRYGKVQGTGVVNVITTGDILNHQGEIISDIQDIQLKSRLGSVKCTDGGKIEANQGKVQVLAKKVFIDETSLVRGSKGTHIVGKTHSHLGSAISGAEVVLGGRVLDIAANVISTAADIQLQQRSDQSVLLRRPVLSAQNLNIYSGEIFNRSQLKAKQHINLGGFQKFSTNKEFLCNTVNNTGRIIAQQGHLNVAAKFIKHTGVQALMSASLNIDISGQHLILLSPLYSRLDLHLRPEAGSAQFQYGDQIYAKGTVHFHLLNNQNDIQYPANNKLGSICFVSGSVDPAENIGPALPMNNHIQFLADQKALGDIKIQGFFSVKVGTQLNNITLLAGEYLVSNSHLFDALNAKLLSGKGMKLCANQDIILGRMEGVTQVAIQSHGDIELEASNNMQWNRLEMIGGGDLRLKASFVDNISSEVFVKNNVCFNSSLVRHRLLVERLSGGHRIPWIGWNCHAFYKTQDASAKALSRSAKFIIGGKLTFTGTMEIFGSQVACGTVVGQLPLLTHFIPFNSYTESSYCGHRKFDKSYWCHESRVICEATISGVLSINSKLEVKAPNLSILGTVFAHDIQISEIQQGLIGQSQQLNLPVPTKAFRQRIPLQEFLEPTQLFTIQESGGDTVYQALLPRNMPIAMEPNLVLRPNFSVTPNVDGLRRLFTDEQEEMLLGKALMSELKRSYLFPGLSDLRQMLSYLKNNAAEFLATESSQALVLAQDLSTILKPLWIYEAVEMIFSSGKTQQILVPVLHLPRSMYNARANDSAAGLFSFADINLQGNGVGVATLTITGHLDAAKQAILKDFNMVNIERRTTTKMHTVVDETVSHGLMGKKSHKTIRKIEEIIPEPGASITVGAGLLLENINHLRLSAAKITSGPLGIQTNHVDLIEERVLEEKKLVCHEGKQRAILGSTTYKLHEAQTIPHATQISSLGPVALNSRVGIYDCIQIQSAVPPMITAEQLSFHVYLRDFEGRLKSLAAEAAEAKRTGNRKKRQAIIKLGASILTSAVGASLLGNYLVASGVVLEKSLMLAAIKGASFGAINSGLMGQNPFAGAAKGALFAGVGYEVGTYLQDSVEFIATLSEPIQAVVVDGISQAVVGGVDALLHHGDVLEAMVIGGASSTAGALIPVNNAASVLVQGCQMAFRAGVTGVTAAALSGSSDYAMNMASAVVGSVARNLGNGLGSTVQFSTTNTINSKTFSNKPSLQSRAVQVPQRRYGLAGGDFERELRATHEKTSEILLDSEFNHSRNQPKGIFGRSVNQQCNMPETGYGLGGVQLPKRDEKVLLWQAPGGPKSLQFPTKSFKPNVVGPSSQPSVMETLQFGAGTLVGGVELLVDMVSDTFEMLSHGADLIDNPSLITPEYESQVRERFISLRDALYHYDETMIAVGNSLKHGFLNACETLESGDTFGAGRQIGRGAVGLYFAANASVSVTKGVVRVAEFSGNKVGVFVALRDFRSPISFHYDVNRLYSGIPVDIVKLRRPWTQKDVLSPKGLNHPVPLLKHEVVLVEKWTRERISLLQKWESEDLTAVNPKMRRLLYKVTKQLRDRMKPDDLAGIYKEQRGFPVPKSEGGYFDHFKNEWSEVQNSFRSVFEEKWSGKPEEIQVLVSRYGEISRIKDTYKEFMERGKCLQEKNILKF